MDKNIAKRVFGNLLATIASYAVLMVIVLFSSQFLIKEGDPFLGITTQDMSWFIKTFMRTPLVWFGYTALIVALLILPAFVFRSIYKSFN